MKAFKFMTGREHAPDRLIVVWIHKVPHELWGTQSHVRFYDSLLGITGELTFCLTISERHIMEAYGNKQYVDISKHPGVEEQRAQAIAQTS